MNALAFVALLLVISVVIIGIVFVGAAALAKVSGIFARLEKGSVYFVNRGDDMKVIWPNVGGYALSESEDFDGRRWLVRVEDKTDDTGKVVKEEDIIMKRFFHGTFPGTRWFQKMLWKRNGIRFVSWIPSLFSNIHKFKVSRRHLLEEGGKEAALSLKERVIASPQAKDEVTSLLFLAPRPIYTEGIELAGDNSKINVLLLAVFQQVIPALPVYYLKGDFFPLLDAAVSAVLIDFFSSHQVTVDENGDFVKDTFEKKDRVPVDDKDSDDTDPKKPRRKERKPNPLTFSHWTKLKKGDSSPLQAYLRQINASLDFYKKLGGGLKRDKESGEKIDENENNDKEELFQQLHRLTNGPPKPMRKTVANMVPHGIIPRFGFALVSVRLIGWEAHKETAALATATQAREIAERNAAGVLAKGRGIGLATKARGEGEAARFTALLDALIAKGVNPGEAAEVIRTQVEMEQLKGSGVTTYVRGGQAPGIMVQGSNPAPHTPVSAPATTPTTPPHSP